MLTFIVKGKEGGSQSSGEEFPLSRVRRLSDLFFLRRASNLSISRRQKVFFIFHCEALDRVPPVPFTWPLAASRRESPRAPGAPPPPVYRPPFLMSASREPRRRPPGCHGGWVMVETPADGAERGNVAPGVSSLKRSSTWRLGGVDPRRRRGPLKRDPPLTQLLVERLDVYNYLFCSLVGGRGGGGAVALQTAVVTRLASCRGHAASKPLLWSL